MTNTQPELSMKWHKFLVNFALWLNAIMNAVYGFQLMTGSHYGSSDTANQVYSAVSGLKSVDMIFGILLIGVAVYMIFTRFQLARFQEGAPQKLTVGYVLAMVIPLGYLLIAVNTMNAAIPEAKLSMGDVADSSTVSSIISSIALIIINRIYYQKRAHLFGNGGSLPMTKSSDPYHTSYESKPVPKEKTCPKCGAKAEPGDVFCVQCGTKLPD